MLTKNSANGFAVWLLNNHPNIFYSIAKKQNPGLGDFTDVLANVGDAFSGAVSSVGTFMSDPKNVASLTSVASSYFASQAAQTNATAQMAVLQTQIARAQSGQPPAPITYTQNAQGQTIPVYTGAPTVPGLGSQVVLGSGQIGYQLTPQALRSVVPPNFLQQYGLWIAGGGALLLILFLATR